MTNSVNLRREAKNDLNRAYHYYESERLGLGTEFLDAIGHRFSSMQAMPDSYPVVYEDVREALVKRFPYAIYFRTEARQIIVYAVYHCSRDPVRWQQRVDELQCEATDDPDHEQATSEEE